jgi:hypothetical protein
MGNGNQGSPREQRFLAFLRAQARAEKSFSVDDVAAATGWATTTVKTYLGKKLKKTGLLEEEGRGRYVARVPDDLTDDDFRRLMSQVADDTDVDTEAAWRGRLDEVVELGFARGWTLSPEQVARLVGRLGLLVGSAAPVQPVVDDVVTAFVAGLPWVARAPVRRLLEAPLEARPAVLLQKVEAHVEAMERARVDNEFVDAVTGRRLAGRVERLIAALPRLEGRSLTLALLAIHYFIADDDGESDLSTAAGFDDDEAVFDAALAALGDVAATLDLEDAQDTE